MPKLIAGHTLVNYDENVSRVIIPNFVYSIADKAFSERGNIKAVEMGASITGIGNYAFRMCYGMREIVLPEEVEEFAQNAADRGLQVIIAGAGMAAALPGVIAASTTIPVIGVPIKGMLDGLDAMLSIIQMPPGIPVATVGVNGAQNAAILAVEMLALADPEIAEKLAKYKDGLKQKIIRANADLAEVQYEFKTN